MSTLMLSSSGTAPATVAKTTKLPSALMSGPSKIQAAGPMRVVTPAWRSRTNMPPFHSVSGVSGASELNATYRPSALTVGSSEEPFSEAPSGPTLISSVSPVAVSCRYTSSR
jgi:hypothetical protein